jgi:hypothetical protein
MIRQVVCWLNSISRLPGLTARQPEILERKQDGITKPALFPRNQQSYDRGVNQTILAQPDSVKTASRITTTIRPEQAGFALGCADAQLACRPDSGIALNER